MVSATEILPEILVLIFEYSQCHEDLLNFALVCRSWAEWAIDVRWRTCEAPLHEIFAVLDLNDGPERDPDIDDDEDAEWSRFVAVSNKVTKVKCDFRLQPSEAMNFDDRRKHLHAGDALFQNVLELIVDMGSSDLRTASIVCSPKSPKSIRMHRAPMGYSMDEGWLVQSTPHLSFASYAQSVESIFVDYSFTQPSPLLHHFAQLRVVECHVFAVHLSWWKDLATCPKLTDLRLRPSTESPASTGAHVVFPILEKFHYTIGNKSTVPEVITWSSFPVLRHLVVHPCPLPQPVKTITAHLRDHSPLLQEFRSGKDFVAQQ